MRLPYTRILATFSGLLLLAGAGCGGGHESSLKAEVSTTSPPVVVTTATLERRSVERTVEIEGTLKAWEEVTVSAKRGGRVLRVLSDMGDHVEPGAKLVELDTTDARLALLQAEARYLSELARLDITRDQADAFVKQYGIDEKLYRADEVRKRIDQLPAVRQARANLAKADLEYQRQQGVYRRGAGSMQDLQNAENDLRASEAVVSNAILTAQTTVAAALASYVAIEIARQDLDEMTILAPLPMSLPDGKPSPSTISYGVTRRMVHEGQRLKDGDPVFELVLEDPIRLWVNVPERYRASIARDQKVRINAQSLPGVAFEGRVDRINPSVDPASRTFQVEALIPNPDGRIRPGGFAKGAIITQRDEQAIVVPIESVYRYAGVTRIFLVETSSDGRQLARGLSVETGRQLDDGWIEVRLPEGQPFPGTSTVVTSGLTRLSDGAVLQVRDPRKEAAAEDASEPSADPARPATPAS